MTIRKLLQKIFYIPTPRALPIRHFSEPGDYTWEDWKVEAKAKYPIKYFLSHTIPHLWNVHVWMNISHFKYYLVSYTLRQYHWLDLRQPKTDTSDDYRWGWADEDRQLIFAMFNILVAHVKVRSESEYHYSATPEGAAKLLKQDPQCVDQANSLLEMYALHQYWTIERKTQLKEKDRLQDIWWQNREEKSFQDMGKFDEEFLATEEEMLIRLVKIRHHLWT